MDSSSENVDRGLQCEMGCCKWDTKSKEKKIPYAHRFIQTWRPCGGSPRSIASELETNMWIVAHCKSRKMSPKLLQHLHAGAQRKMTIARLLVTSPP